MSTINYLSNMISVEWCQFATSVLISMSYFTKRDIIAVIWSVQKAIGKRATKVGSKCLILKCETGMLSHGS